MQRDKLGGELEIGGDPHHHQIDRLKKKRDVSTGLIRRQWL